MTDPALFRAFHRLHTALELPATARERQSRLSACLDLYLQRCMERTPRRTAPAVGHTGLRRAAEFLHAHLGDNCSLDDLADIAGLSRFHLLRAFARELGVPPHEYQIQLRVAEARRLRHGQSILEVAYELGFADQSHLTRHFKRIIGVTPGAYVRAVSPSRGGRSV